MPATRGFDGQPNPSSTETDSLPEISTPFKALTRARPGSTQGLGESGGLGGDERFAPGDQSTAVLAVGAQLRIIPGGKPIDCRPGTRSTRPQGVQPLMKAPLTGAQAQGDLPEPKRRRGLSDPAAGPGGPEVAKQQKRP